MYLVPLYAEEHIRKRGIPLVTSGDKSRPDSIFSTDVFGVTGEDRMTKTALIPLNTHVLKGWALDKIKIIDRTIYNCATTKGLFLIKNGEISAITEDYRKESLDEVIGYGPEFLYMNWDKIDKSKYKTTEGKVANIEMKNAFTEYSRDKLFKSFQFVSSLVFREEEQDSTIIMNDTNKILADIARFANLIKTNTDINTTDLKVYLQCKCEELYEDQAKLFGSHGLMREKFLSRPVDNSIRSVILPAVFDSNILGKSRFNTDSVGVSIYQVNKMFIDTTKRGFKDLIQVMYDSGVFKEGTAKHLLSVYDNDFMTDAIDKFLDNFTKVSNFPAITPEGEFEDLYLDFAMEDGTVINKPLTWLEFFFILHSRVTNTENERWFATTRYPVDNDKSLQVVKPVPLTLTHNLLKTVSVLAFKDIEFFPFVDDYVKENYQQKIFETGFRVPSTVVVGYNGDHDGDQAGGKGFNSKEAVEEGKKYHENLLSLFNHTGDFSRKLGKATAQCLWSLTRGTRRKEKAKEIKPDHPLIVHFMESENGSIDLNLLFKYTTVYGTKAKADIMMYDEVTVKTPKGTIKTTVGRLFINRTILVPFWNIKEIPFHNDILTEKKYVSLMEEYQQYVIEKHCTVADLKRSTDLYAEIALRLATVYNASITDNMLLTSDEFKKIRDAEFDKVKDKIIKNNDAELLNKTIATIIEKAKTYYADDDMAELFESSGKSKWDGDFAQMQISIGAVPSLNGKNINIIMNSLTDGLPLENMADFASTAMRGAIDRGKETELAGSLNKNIQNAVQSVMAYRGDCKSKEGVKVNYTDRKLLFNRYVIEKNGSITKITLSNIAKYIGKDIIIRSPIHCKTKHGHFCSTCTGTSPFDILGTDEMNIGMFISILASNMLNLFMSSTHELIVKTFRIDDFNAFIFPRFNKDIFYIKKDETDGIEKIYTKEDIRVYVPKSSVTPIDASYHVLLHGAIIKVASNEAVSHAVTFGSEVKTTPFNITKPTGVDGDQKHYVLHYNKNTPFLNDTLSMRKTMTVYKMMKAYLTGAVSNIIPLDAHFETLQHTMLTNKSLGANMINIEILLGTFARDAKDVSKTVRETGKSEYLFIGTDDLTTVTNTFNALTGPDAGRALFSAMNKSYEDQTAKPSPIEKVFRS